MLSATPRFASVGPGLGVLVLRQRQCRVQQERIQLLIVRKCSAYHWVYARALLALAFVFDNPSCFVPMQSIRSPT